MFKWCKNNNIIDKSTSFAKLIGVIWCDATCTFIIYKMHCILYAIDYNSELKELRQKIERALKIKMSIRYVVHVIDSSGTKKKLCGMRN